MTPYAKYHLRLIEIDRRWFSLAARTKTYPQNQWRWTKARSESLIAFAFLLHDILYFDEQVHPTPRREEMPLFNATTPPQSLQS